MLAFLSATAAAQERIVLVAPFENHADVHAPTWTEVPGTKPEEPKRRVQIDRWSEAPRGILEDVLVNAKVSVVERQRVDSMLQESQFKGMTDDGQGVALGKLLGANFVLMGTVWSVNAESKSFSGYGVQTEMIVVAAELRVRLIDIESGRVVASKRCKGEKRFQKSQFGGAQDSDVAFKVIENALDSLSKDEDFLSAVRGPASKPKEGMVNVSFEPIPGNCDVDIDGVYAGGSPLTVPLVSGRPVKVKISKAGYQPWEKQIIPAVGQKPITPELAKEK
ncbi:MAG TPA: CsgG/HfaB family protein [Planctomycetota bacterium]|nr:CsgG/HfaB family protein [Planctomycetota bacterium]